MKLKRQERLAMMGAFHRMVEKNPPKMPQEFSHNEYKRLIRYARISFITGYYTGMNDLHAASGDTLAFHRKAEWIRTCDKLLQESFENLPARGNLRRRITQHLIAKDRP